MSQRKRVISCNKLSSIKCNKVKKIPQYVYIVWSLLITNDKLLLFQFCLRSCRSKNS